MLETSGVKEALAFLGERCQMDRIRLQNGLQGLKNMTLEVKSIEREFAGKVDSMNSKVDLMYRKMMSMYKKEFMYSEVDEMRNHSMASKPAQWLFLDLGIMRLENQNAVIGIGSVILVLCFLFLLVWCLVRTKDGKRRREVMKVRRAYNEQEMIWNFNKEQQ